MRLRALERVAALAEEQASIDDRTNPAQRARDLVQEAEEAAADVWTSTMPADMVEVPCTWTDVLTLADFDPVED